MINTLESIVLKDLRKNFTFDDSPQPEIYEAMWEDLIKTSNIDKECKYFKLFKKFIEKEDIKNVKGLYKIDNSILRVLNLDGSDRKNLHSLCDKMGLHHESVKSGKNRKDFLVTIPKCWKFEYSPPNPYEGSSNYQRKKNISCDRCGETGDKCELYKSVCMREIVCENCLENDSDGEGGSLKDHQFDPLF